MRAALSSTSRDSDSSLGWEALPGPARLYVSMVIAAGALTVAAIWPMTLSRPGLFAVLMAAACLTSMWKVTLPLPLSSGATLSVSYTASLMALMLLDTPQAILVGVAGAWAQCVFQVKRRYPGYRTAFSMSAEAITVAAAGAAYSALDGGLSPEAIGGLPRAVVGSIVAYFIVNSWLVAFAIGLSSGRSPWRIWRDDFLWAGPSFMVAGTAGAIGAVIIARENHWLAILVAAPIYLTYRTYQVFLGRIEDERAHLVETQKLHGEAVEALLQARRAEQALAHEKERLAVTLRSIGDGVIATDLEGRVILLNRAAEVLTGSSQAEATGQPFASIFKTLDPDTRARRDNSIEALTRREAPGPCRSTILVGKGLDEHPIEEAIAPLRDSAGRRIGMVVAFRDITDALRMREERTRSDRVAALGLLAGGMAHDFNAILATVMGNVSMARAHAAPGSAAALSLEEAEQACCRARQLTWRLLTFSKGGLPLKKSIGLGGPLADAVRGATHGAGATCRLEVASDLCVVMADEQQLSQVFDNVLLNAQQAMPHGGTIEIRAENVTERIERWEYALKVVPGPYVRVSFTDTGIGIPAEHLGRIFDPYFTTKQRGAGLGLATCYSILKGHGGFVTVKSTLGQGTTVAIHLPAAGPAADAAADHVRHLQGRGRILLMENEAAAQAVAVNMLAFLGHDTEVVPDGAAAIESYRSALALGRPFDAVILDLVSGGVGGHETITRLSELDPDVNAIAAGFAQDPAGAGFRRHGFKAVLSKPFTLQELRSTIDSVIVTPRSCTIH
jgi:PAS domain S-box-containing protein